MLVFLKCNFVPNYKNVSWLLLLSHHSCVHRGLWNFEANSASQTGLCGLPTILEPFLLCGSSHYPAERGHSHRGMSFPWKGVHSAQQRSGRGYMSKEHSRTRRVWAEHAHSITLTLASCLLPIVHPGTECISHQWPGHLLLSLCGPALMLAYPWSVLSAVARGPSMATLTGLQLH